MSPSPLTLDTPSTIASDRTIESSTSEHQQQVAKLSKALYPVDRQEKFLELQAEVETLFCQLRDLQRVRA